MPTTNELNNLPFSLSDLLAIQFTKFSISNSFFSCMQAQVLHDVWKKKNKFFKKKVRHIHTEWTRFNERNWQFLVLEWNHTKTKGLRRGMQEPWECKQDGSFSQTVTVHFHSYTEHWKSIESFCTFYLFILFLFIFFLYVKGIYNVKFYYYDVKKKLLN